MLSMTKVLKEAMEALSNLPEAGQEQIGRELLLHVGKGRVLDVEDVISRARGRYAKG